ncbi:sigma-54 dependent transcriptional regulator [bacterium]|nr:sigma-54 dependent transcriptional regulator [bacterium]
MTSETANLAVRDRLIGRSDVIGEVRTLIRRVAPTKISVLVTGASGTGKEVVARLIHDLSPRRDAQFVPVNCGAIPEGLFESEMFGHERGSFTGADRQRKGFFEQADGGTLFLDEVGDMPLEMQVKVLRALETGEYFRVGGNKSVKTDIRVLAATNRDLRADVERARFREDLYFRLRAVEINIPPLRERPEDIPPLVEQFADDFFRENKIERVRLLPSAMDTLQQAEWRGNVRELKNFIGTLLTLERDEPIDDRSIRRHLPAPTGSHLPVLAPVQRGTLDNEMILQQLIDIRRDIQQMKETFTELLLLGRRHEELPERVHYTTVDGEPPLRPTLEEVERDQIRQALIEQNGNRRKAAEILGIGERTLYRKIKEYNL